MFNFLLLLLLVLWYLSSGTLIFEDPVFMATKKLKRIIQPKSAQLNQAFSPSTLSKTLLTNYAPMSLSAHPRWRFRVCVSFFYARRVWCPEFVHSVLHCSPWPLYLNRFLHTWPLSTIPVHFKQSTCSAVHLPKSTRRQGITSTCES